VSVVRFHLWPPPIFDATRQNIANLEATNAAGTSNEVMCREHPNESTQQETMYKGALRAKISKALNPPMRQAHPAKRCAESTLTKQIPENSTQRKIRTPLDAARRQCFPTVRRFGENHESPERKHSVKISQTLKRPMRQAHRTKRCAESTRTKPTPENFNPRKIRPPRNAAKRRCFPTVRRFGVQRFEITIFKGVLLGHFTRTPGFDPRIS